MIVTDYPRNTRLSVVKSLLNLKSNFLKSFT